MGRRSHLAVLALSDNEAVHDMRLSRCSPTRMPLAIAVRAGLTAPMLGKKLVSTTWRLGHQAMIVATRLCVITRCR